MSYVYSMGYISSYGFTLGEEEGSREIDLNFGCPIPEADRERSVYRNVRPAVETKMHSQVPQVRLQK